MSTSYKLMRFGGTPKNLRQIPVAIRVALLAVVMPSGCVLLHGEDVEWPPSVLSKLDRLISIQRKMRIEPGMMLDLRREQHREFDSLLSKLGSGAELVSMEEVLRRVEGESLRAKLAVMALDFSKNPNRYKEIRHLYVEKPLSVGGVSDYVGISPPSAVRPKIVKVVPVRPEHTNELFRLAFEYQMLAPLDVIIFEDTWRVIRSALASINNRDSRQTFMEIAATTSDSFPFGGSMLVDQSLLGLAEFPSIASLNAIASVTEVSSATKDRSRCRDLVLDYIGGRWGTFDLYREVFETDLDRYRRWRRFVGNLLDSELDVHGRSLAEAIASLPEPPKFGPSDPFRPRH